MTAYFEPYQFRAHPQSPYGEGTVSRYLAVGDARPKLYSSGEMEHPYVEMMVHHVPESYHAIWSDSHPSGYDFEYLKNVRDRSAGEGSSAASDLTTQGAENDPERYAEKVKRFQNTPEGSPDTLFAHFPAQHIITDAYADPSMKVAVPMLGAMAHMRASQGGQSAVMTVSNSLSAQSSPLAKNAIKKGLPVQAHHMNPDAVTTNKVREKPLAMDAHFYQAKVENSPPLNDQQVGEIRTHLRSMLRGTPTKAVPVNTPKFHQPTLPGF